MKKFLTILPLIVAFIIGLMTVPVKAAYKSNDPTVKSGETITITLTSTQALENYDVSLGKHDGLSYLGCSATNAAVNSSSGKISFATLGTPVTTLGTYTFKAPQVTQTTKYTVTFNVNGTTNTSTVTVNPISNNNSGSNNNSSSSNSSSSSSSSGTTTTTKASITKVVINGITVKKDLPVTNKDSVTVSVTTSNGEGLKIYNSLTKKTISADSGKAVTVPIMEGTNTLTITLNSGATATRKIYSQKEEEETPGNFIEEPQEDIKVLLKSLSIKSVKSEEEETIDFKLTPEFSSEIYEYSIIIPEEYNDITKLDIKAIASQDDFTVEITGNENLVDGENIVTILVKSKDGEKSATYKIIVNKEAKAVEAVAEPVEDVPQTISEEENNSIKITKIAIVVFTSIVAILGIIFAVVEYMYGKKHNNEEEIGTIPYSSIGFEKEEKGKEDILEDLRKDDKDVQEDEKPKRKGKHF